jgi:hypothetical protein
MGWIAPAPPSDRVETGARLDTILAKAMALRYNVAGQLYPVCGRKSLLTMVESPSAMKPSIQFLPSADHSLWKDRVSKVDGLPIRDSGAWIEDMRDGLTHCVQGLLKRY